MNRKINKKEMKLLNEILSKSKLTLKDAEAISDKIDKSITKNLWKYNIWSNEKRLKKQEVKLSLNN